MKNSKNKFYVCLIAVIFCLVSANTVWALRLPLQLPSSPLFTPVFLDKIFGKKKEAAVVDHYAIHDEASFKALTKTFHQIPYSNPKMEYDIAVPKNWTIEQVAKDTRPELSNMILKDIVRFKSPLIGTYHVSITVRSIQLTQELSTDIWLKNYIISQGYTLQNNVTAQSSKRASASFIQTLEGKSVYTYTVAQANGNIMMMARFDVPIELQEYLDFVTKRTIDSFRLIQPNIDSIESQKTFTLADAIKFSYPESWAINDPDFRNPSRMSVQLLQRDQNEQINGFIRFIAIRRSPQTTLKKESEALRTYLNDSVGVDIIKLKSSSKAAAYSRFSFSRYEIYQIASKKSNKRDQELHSIVLGDKDWYIFIFLLTPTETNNLLFWAHNTLSLEMILNSMK
jgi:hypothetical protein